MTGEGSGVAATKSSSAAIPGTAAAERLALALQAGRIGTWHWDLRTGTIDRDASMDDILGIEPGSSTPGFEEYVARVHPDDQPGFGKTLQAALAGRSPRLSVEHRIVRPDGEVRWLEAKAHLSYGADGAPTELVGVVVDVTERHASQQASAAASRARELATERVGAVERRIALLARAADLLDAPLDLDAALQEVANLAIDVLADWCTVDLLTEGQQIHRAAVAHRDPAMVARAQELQRKYPPGHQRPGIPTPPGEPGADLRRALRRRHAHCAGQGPGAARGGARVPHQPFLVVPLVAGGRGIGTISLIATHGRHLNPEDVELAVDLGRRSGAAVEKTRLYAELRETSQVLQASLLPATLPESPARHCRRTTVRAPRGCRSVVTSTTSSAPDLDRWWVALATSVEGPGRGGTHGGGALLGARRRPGHDRPRRGPAPAQRRAPRPGGGRPVHHLGRWRPSGTRPGRLGGRARRPHPIVLSVASAGHPAPLHFSPGARGDRRNR